MDDLEEFRGIFSYEINSTSYLNFKQINAINKKKKKNGENSFNLLRINK